MIAIASIPGRLRAPMLLSWGVPQVLRDRSGGDGGEHTAVAVTGTTIVCGQQDGHRRCIRVLTICRMGASSGTSTVGAASPATTVTYI